MTNPSLKEQLEALSIGSASTTNANKLHALSAKAKTNKAAKKQFASLNRAHSKHY